jgi:hypothetical protein
LSNQINHFKGTGLHHYRFKINYSVSQPCAVATVLILSLDKGLVLLTAAVKPPLSISMYPVEITSKFVFFSIGAAST